MDLFMHAVITFRNHCVEQIEGLLTSDIQTYIPCMTSQDA